jgi:mannose/cellobiose epimerase-like protein (N-acyl-D-glucosamine 2-epimerase family)
VLLDFAARSRRPEGFGYLLADGTVDEARGLETWINARMTHVFSLALLDGHDTGSLVQHGIAALRGPLHDAEHGGWFRTTDDTSKAAYEHAFVLLAGASAAAAGVDDRLVREALDVWDERFWDDDAGAVVESYAQDWSGLEEYRGANSNMHGVEAGLAAADVLPDRAGDLRGRALRVVERFVHREAGSRDWRLPEHFDSSWQAQLDYNRDRPADPFRPYGVTVGHQFEWARLAVHLGAVLADPPSWLRADAEALYAAAVERGGAADGHPGFVYTLDWEDRPVVTARMHWVLAEAISAAHVLGHPGDAQRWEAHAAEVFADPRTGNWHHELTPTGEVSTGTWSGQPDAYHVLQSQLLARLPVRGSLAAGLLA